MNDTLTPDAKELIPLKCTAQVISSERITPADDQVEVREIVLEVDDASFQAEPGQSIAVMAPVPPGVDEKEHVRMYSVADVQPGSSGRPRVTIFVRRCAPPAGGGALGYGIASNYLCDLEPGEPVTLSGPFGIPFNEPAARDANVILIGSGTGIAPFRAFVKHLHKDVKGWSGRVWLFYGDHGGLDFLYMNHRTDDLARYCDQETYEAFQALSPKPNWADPLAWDHAFAERAAEIFEMLADEKTYVYVAGLRKTGEKLDAIFREMAGGDEAWSEKKADLAGARRWVEILYG